MRKNVITMMALSLLAVVLSFSSCTYYENVNLIGHGDERYLSYQENKYYEASVFEHYSVADANDVDLGMYYSFPFTTYYHSYTAESPVYIYSTGGLVYIRQDYDWRSEPFVIGDTAATIVFSEAIADPCFTYDPLIHSDHTVELLFYAEQYPNLKISARLFFDGTDWYLGLPTNEAYSITPFFEKVLQENEIIPEKESAPDMIISLARGRMK